MSTIYASFQKNKTKESPLTFTLGDEQVKVYINWEKSTSKEIYLTVNAATSIDVLIPSTFARLKDKIKELEDKLSSVLYED